jgi:hypothetical protein
LPYLRSEALVTTIGFLPRVWQRTYTNFYQFSGDKPPEATKIDIFDLASGRKIAARLYYLRDSRLPAIWEMK